MRWTIRIGVPTILAWVAFTLSPFVAFYRLAEAVQARDVAAVSERVDFRSLRRSVARQIVADYLARKRPGLDSQGLRRQAAVGIGATVLDPLIERFTTADALIRFLEEGTTREGASPAAASEALQFGQLDFRSLRTLWRLWADAASWGFRQVTIYVAPPTQLDERFGFTMRFGFGSLRWRLIGVELPAGLRARLLKELPSEAG